MVQSIHGFVALRNRVFRKVIAAALNASGIGGDPVSRSTLLA
jgi:hypothetical protein